MRSFDKIPLNLTVDTEQGTDEMESSAEKPGFVKKIEGFDVHNLTPENIEFMTRTIQDYFLENFPVKPELVEQLPERITILSTEDFKEAHKEASGDAETNIEGITGFYDPNRRKVFIDGPANETPGALFSTMFHEGLHFVSIGAGAGLVGAFLHPIEAEEYEETSSMIEIGVNTLEEGTTQLITLESVLGDMKFDKVGKMFGYEPERLIMGAIWAPFDNGDRMHAYFEMSMEDLRIFVEKMLSPDEDRDRIGPNVLNEMFTDCLYSLGATTEDMREALESWEGGRGLEEILRDVRHAVGFFIVRSYEANKIELSEAEKRDLRDYLGPYIEGKEEENGI